MTLKTLLLVAAVLFVPATPAAPGQRILDPKEHFGFEPGADRRLLSWEELVAYYRHLDEASPRLRMEVAGTTTLGRPLVEIVVSGLDDGALEGVRARQEVISRGRLTDEDLEATLRGQPVVVYVQATLHSTEIAASLLFPRFLHRLVTANDDATRELLSRVVLVVVPSANPDGIDTVRSWYEETLDTPHEGTAPPFLYQAYAGHDNNRDWFMQSLVETRIVSRLLYRKWFPTVVLDIHQMGGKGARMFVPPFSDPINPNLPPLLSRLIDVAGHHMALALTLNGCSGVVQDVVFDNYWTGGARNIPVRHNMIGLLTETASAKLATPLRLDPGELKGHGVGLPEYKAQGNFPDPWPGGAWRMADIIRYQDISTRALLDFAARHRELLVSTSLELARRQISQGRSGPPYAFLIPPSSDSPSSVRRLARILLDGGVEVQVATADFQLDGARFPAGTFVIDAAQSYRAFVKDLLERQHYPELRAIPGGEVLRPYDAAAWTLPLQFGIDCHLAATPVPERVGRRPLTDLPPDAPSFDGEGGATRFRASGADNASWVLAHRAVARGVAVRRETTGRRDFVFDATTAAELETLGTGIAVRLVGERNAEAESTPVERPRVAIYSPWPEPMDAGWTRLVLEEHGFEPVRLLPPEARAGRLRERFDAIVLPSVSPKRLREGATADELPARFQGGLGSEGTRALRDFVAAGGRLVAFPDATPFVVESFELPVEFVNAGPPRNPATPESDDKPASPGKVVCPGSLLRAVRAAPAADPHEEYAVFQDSGTAFRLVERSGTRTPRAILAFPKSDLLLSGYLEGERTLAGAAALVTAEWGGGTITLFAFRPQHRSQTLGTFRLLFDALHGVAP